MNLIFIFIFFLKQNKIVSREIFDDIVQVDEQYQKQGQG